VGCRTQAAAAHLSATRGWAQRLSGKLGRSPSPQQLAGELNLPIEEVLEAISANAAYLTASLDTPLRPGDGERQTVADSLREEDEGFELIEDRASIGPALETLPQRERLILRLRFVEDLLRAKLRSA
jgi:RNA polymerase sigma-B factor